VVVIIRDCISFIFQVFFTEVGMNFGKPEAFEFPESKRTVAYFSSHFSPFQVLVQDISLLPNNDLLSSQVKTHY
jgi:hypothetical protein